jgi:hypothetical protein
MEVLTDNEGRLIENERNKREKRKEVAMEARSGRYQSAGWNAWVRWIDPCTERKMTRMVKMRRWKKNKILAAIAEKLVARAGVVAKFGGIDEIVGACT